MSVWDLARTRLDGLPGGEGRNIAFEAVDRHVAHGNGDRIALRFLSSEGAARDVRYRTLALDSNRFANGLDALGVGSGDVVATLLGRVPELYIAAMGTLKAGAVLCTLFAAFGPEPVRVRLAKGHVKVLVTTARQYRRKIEPLRRELPDLKAVILIDEALPGTCSWQRLMAAASDRWRIPATSPDSLALIHFTSGTTGTPKGAVHVHEAVVAHEATAAAVLTLGPGDLFWCTADPGWVTGVSYGIIAPLVRGATSVIDDGVFEPERWYRILHDQSVTIWYTAPTAIRMLMKAGDALARRHDFRTLRLAASVGEPLDAGAVAWGEAVLGRPFHDTWWQTETGAIMIANLPDAPVCPGAMGRPLAGIEAAVVERCGGPEEAPRIEPAAEAGELALKVGWPSMFRGYVDDEARYRAVFADGYYLTGDRVRRDEDGWYWFLGRADDVIKSAGRLIGPIEVESVLLQHPAVAEAAVIGLPDPTVGEMVKAYVTVKDGIAADEALRRDILAAARSRLGAATAPRDIAFHAALPKTRSGKIMRRLLRARELGLPEGDLSTLDESTPVTTSDSTTED
ncbi:MAG: acetate--CoA ligase [Rhodospirillales bacterium]|nr:MAG: acetate--CoA ligase [Rhodospirillales bacterium]